ncbi:MAG TPA: D-cysteine desulfhydrase family protein [Candidatus Bipolaricaulis anaerobius]|nr:D-cysteine desulfhydrase family protein [Candidatus Bipolaricaulis anaerobius]HNS23706.1 D-cysteine desulfhydrase family protein [Candidatus Bipolaricaulis anaerobius]
MNNYVTVKELRAKIDALPRVKLAALPTPLHELPRFSKALGGPRIFIKRDDLTGLAFGGNKTRMFEFLLAQAIQEGADTIIGGAGVQSNYSRQLVAACRALGLEVHLILRRIRGKKDNDIQGNLLLDLIAGATVRIIDATAEEQAKAMYDLANTLEKQGKRPCVVRLAQDKDLSPDVLAYANCFCEIVEQCEALDIQPTHLYCASYDSTQAGLELGKAALGSRMHIMGIAPADWMHGVSDLIARYVNQAAKKIGLSLKVDKSDVFNTADYVGQGYGVVTPDVVEMIKLMARTEGIFLDPVYTGKAMAGLRDHIRKGILTKNDTVIFLHTGGTPALFAYVDDLGLDELVSHVDLQ